MLLHLQYLAPCYEEPAPDPPILLSYLYPSYIQPHPSSSSSTSSHAPIHLDESIPSLPWKNEQRYVTTTSITPDAATTTTTNTTNTTTTQNPPDNNRKRNCTSMRIDSNRPRIEEGWRKLEKRRKTFISYSICRPASKKHNECKPENSKEVRGNGDIDATTGTTAEAQEVLLREGGQMKRGEKVRVRQIRVRSSFWGNPEGLRRKRKRKVTTTFIITF